MHLLVHTIQPRAMHTLYVHCTLKPGAHSPHNTPHPTGKDSRLFAPSFLDIGLGKHTHIYTNKHLLIHTKTSTYKQITLKHTHKTLTHTTQNHKQTHCGTNKHSVT